jgi:hypothetical protein
MTKAKVGATKYNQSLTRVERATCGMRDALKAAVNAVGSRNPMALHYLSIAGLELSEVQDAARVLREIGRGAKDARTK